MNFVWIKTTFRIIFRRGHNAVSLRHQNQLGTPTWLKMDSIQFDYSDLTENLMEIKNELSKLEGDDLMCGVI